MAGLAIVDPAIDLRVGMIGLSRQWAVGSGQWAVGSGRDEPSGQCCSWHAKEFLHRSVQSVSH